MQASPALIITGIAALFILYILCRIFIRPLKWFLRLGLSCIIGCATMFLANKLLIFFGISFSLNPLTAVISGVLGLPGMAMILLVQALL